MGGVDVAGMRRRSRGREGGDVREKRGHWEWRIEAMDRARLCI
jgi:hypothetical protein